MSISCTGRILSISSWLAAGPRRLHGSKYHILLLSIGNYKKGVEWMTYLAAALTVICLLTTLLMIRRIKIAIACIRVAANAIGTIPSIIFFPIITFISFVGLFVYWVIVFVNQWSGGVVTETYRQATSTEYSKYSLKGLYESASDNFTAPTFTGTDMDISTNTMTPCHESPDCYYSIEFTQRQQVRLRDDEADTLSSYLSRCGNTLQSAARLVFPWRVF